MSLIYGPSRIDEFKNAGALVSPLIDWGLDMNTHARMTACVWASSGDVVYLEAWDSDPIVILPPAGSTAKAKVIKTWIQSNNDGTSVELNVKPRPKVGPGNGTVTLKLKGGDSAVLHFDCISDYTVGIKDYYIWDIKAIEVPLEYEPLVIIAYLVHTIIKKARETSHLIQSALPAVAAACATVNLSGIAKRRHVNGRRCVEPRASNVVPRPPTTTAIENAELNAKIFRLSKIVCDIPPRPDPSARRLEWTAESTKMGFVTPQHAAASNIAYRIKYGDEIKEEAANDAIAFEAGGEMHTDNEYLADVPRAPGRSAESSLAVFNKYYNGEEDEDAVREPIAMPEPGIPVLPSTHPLPDEINFPYKEKNIPYFNRQRRFCTSYSHKIPSGSDKPDEESIGENRVFNKMTPIMYHPRHIKKSTHDWNGDAADLYVAQVKMDGNRATWDGYRELLISANAGIPIIPPNEWIACMPKHCILDGELVFVASDAVVDTSTQFKSILEATSKVWAYKKTQQPQAGYNSSMDTSAWSSMKFYAFDIVGLFDKPHGPLGGASIEHSPFHQRQAMLRYVIDSFEQKRDPMGQVPNPTLVRLPSYKVTKLSDFDTIPELFRCRGAEGVVFKHALALADSDVFGIRTKAFTMYKRTANGTKQWLKYKFYDEEEGTVISIGHSVAHEMPLVQVRMKTTQALINVQYALRRIVLLLKPTATVVIRYKSAITPANIIARYRDPCIIWSSTEDNNHPIHQTDETQLDTLEPIRMSQYQSTAMVAQSNKRAHSAEQSDLAPDFGIVSSAKWVGKKLVLSTAIVSSARLVWKGGVSIVETLIKNESDKNSVWYNALPSRYFATSRSDHLVKAVNSKDLLGSGINGPDISRFIEMCGQLDGYVKLAWSHIPSMPEAQRVTAMKYMEDLRIKAVEYQIAVDSDNGTVRLTDSAWHLVLLMGAVYAVYANWDYITGKTTPLANVVDTVPAVAVRNASDAPPSDVATQLSRVREELEKSQKVIQIMTAKQLGLQVIEVHNKRLLKQVAGLASAAVSDAFDQVDATALLMKALNVCQVQSAQILERR